MPKPSPRLAVSLLFLAATSSVAAAEIDRRVAAKPDGTVEISNLVGSVEVRGWGENAVEVRGRTSGPADIVEVEGHGGHVEIETQSPFGPNAASADLEIRVPESSRVRIETLSANVEISAVSGALEIESVSGRIRVDGRPRSADVENVSGGIEIRNEVPELWVSTVSGDLDLAGGREVEASAISGRLRVRGGRVERADLEVVSGEIEFSGELLPGARFDATSHSGSVVLNLSPKTSASFEASTFSGRIRNELGPPARSVSPYTSEQELDFTLGKGEARVRIETFSGRIEIRQR